MSEAQVEALADVLNLSPLRCTCGREQHDFCGTRIARHLLASPEFGDLLNEARREAWDEGYARGVRDECCDMERADNPYDQKGADQ